jgi:D-inositol-3-phosphate glycosyltransferase
VRIVVLDPGGYTAHYNGNLCHELALRGHEVRLDTSRYLFENVEPLGGYEVRHLFFNSIPRQGGVSRWGPTRQLAKAVVYPTELRSWARLLRCDPPDVLHVQWSHLPPLDVRVFRSLRQEGVRLVFTAHELPRGRRGPWVGAFSELCRLAEAVVVHASAPAQRLVDELGVPEARVHVLPMGGPGRYAAAPVSRADARSRLGIDEGVQLALFFGLIKPHKGLDVLLESLPLARRRLPSLQLLVAGRPMASWRRYEAQIEALGLRDVVHLRLDFVPSEELNVVFGAADAVVTPYKRAAQSMVVLTAWQFGRPVLATRVGGLPELIRDGVSGRLAEPDDPVDLARVLADMLSDEDGLKRMSSGALEMSSGPHAWASIAALHERIYTARG